MNGGAGSCHYDVQRMPAARAPRPSPKKTASEPAPVYALVGADSYLQQQALDAILDRQGDDVQRSDVEGPSAVPAEVFDELRSFAMFGGSRVVVVRDADDFISKNREALETFLEAAGGSAGNVLVLRCASLPKNTRIYKLIDKVGRVIAAEPPKERELPRWIIGQGKDVHRITVAPDAAALLADLIGVDLGTLDNELAKLSLQTENGRVTADMIAGGVAFRREQQMWTMTDALAAGRPEQALRIWRQLLATDNSAEFRAVTWLGIWLEKSIAALRLSQQGRNAFAIARDLRIWPAENAEGLIRTARSLGEPRLRRATDRLAEIDYRTKTGLGEATRAVEDFILRTAG
jgi:DNA polymerase-3 subunit delta